MDNLLSIFLFTVVMTITPGPNNFMILYSGLNFGLRKSLPHLFGIAFGFPLMLLVVGLGLDIVIQKIPTLSMVVKVFGVSYLLFLAYKIFTTSKQNISTGECKPLTFFQAVLFQWANPKAWIMIFSGIGSFASDINVQSTTIVIALSFFLAIFPCSGSWLFLGAEMQQIINSAKHYLWFNRTMAILLIASVLPVFW